VEIHADDVNSLCCLSGAGSFASSPFLKLLRAESWKDYSYERGINGEVSWGQGPTYLNTATLKLKSEANSYSCADFVEAIFICIHYISCKMLSWLVWHRRILCCSQHLSESLPSLACYLYYFPMKMMFVEPNVFDIRHLERCWL
jgi:hypothetical protein